MATWAHKRPKVCGPERAIGLLGPRVCLIRGIVVWRHLDLLQSPVSTTPIGCCVFLVIPKAPRGKPLGPRCGPLATLLVEHRSGQNTQGPSCCVSSWSGCWVPHWLAAEPQMNEKQLVFVITFLSPTRLLKGGPWVQFGTRVGLYRGGNSRSGRSNKGASWSVCCGCRCLVPYFEPPLKP